MSDAAPPEDSRLVPFSDEYIALCRNAALDRTIQAGDYVAESAGPPRVKVLLADGPPTDARQAGWVWLPRLDQLLELLGAYGSITLLSLGTQASKGWICKFGNRDGHGVAGKTAEEAALYLLLSVLSREPSSTASPHP